MTPDEERAKEMILDHITYSLAEVTLIKQQVDQAKAALDTLVVGVSSDDGRKAQEAWEEMTQPVEYIQTILQQRAAQTWRRINND